MVHPSNLPLPDVLVNLCSILHSFRRLPVTAPYSLSSQKESSMSQLRSMCTITHWYRMHTSL